MALVLPNEAKEGPEGKPIGLAAIAGGLADWEDLEDVVAEIYQARRNAKERRVPDIE